MFYRLKLQDHIRVPPNLFSEDVNISILAMLKKKFDGWISKDLGIVVGVTGIDEVQDGIIIPGDGASYYGVIFQLVTFKPELQEVVLGKVKDLADFGAFMNIGPTEGMIHISQTMNDFVSFSKDKVLMGKESKRNLRIGDRCLARIIAVSYKDLSNPKLGLTMRQKGLGKLEWVQEDEDEEKEKGKKAEKK